LFGRAGTAVIRPERITIDDPATPAPDDRGSATGSVREVLFHGSESRWIVDLDAGAAFIVTRPNGGFTGSSSGQVAPKPGDRVLLSWSRDDVLGLEGGSSAETATAQVHDSTT
jgi:hypothetical protein